MKTKFEDFLNESIRDKMIPKSKEETRKVLSKFSIPKWIHMVKKMKLDNSYLPSEEEISIMRKKYLKYHEVNKKAAIELMENLANKLEIKSYISESGKVTYDGYYFSVNMKYNDITYYISIKPFEDEFNVGFYNNKDVGNWEDEEYLEDCVDHIERWIEENEYRRKNNIEYK